MRAKKRPLEADLLDRPRFLKLRLSQTMLPHHRSYLLAILALGLFIFNYQQEAQKS